MIQVENLVKDFKLTSKQRKELGVKDDYYRAVDSITFSCQPGRIFSLLGPNGAGKTTTLRILSTIFSPTSGKVSVCGFDVTKEPQKVREKIGFLTGSTGLYGRLTPNELLDYFANLYTVNTKEHIERKAYLIDLLKMETFMNKRISKLSTGMKQKVSICRTIIHDPEIVIFDEPTSGLDVVSAENIISLIRDCKNQGKTVIFSSHIMSEVDLLCDDLGIIHQGKMKFLGDMNSFRTNMKEVNLTSEFIRIVNNEENLVNI